MASSSDDNEGYLSIDGVGLQRKDAMNRRSFLSKICALLPILGASSLVGRPGASEGQRERRCKKEWTYVVARYNGKGNSDGIDINPKRIGTENSWNDLGCKDCFRGCGQWDICMATLRKRLGNTVETWSASGKTYYVDEVNGDDKNDGLTWRNAKKNWVKILDN